jgi:hypothetical protein
MALRLVTGLLAVLRRLPSTDLLASFGLLDEIRLPLRRQLGERVEFRALVESGSNGVGDIRNLLAARYMTPNCPLGFASLSGGFLSISLIRVAILAT